ncbi:DUF2849 domain-containing protein [Seohaeicola zhoushanensis]
MSRPYSPKVVTANDLLLGDVIYQTAANDWTRDLAEAEVLRDEASADLRLRQAVQQPGIAVGAYSPRSSSAPTAPSPPTSAKRSAPPARPTISTASKPSAPEDQLCIPTTTSTKPSSPSATPSSAPRSNAASAAP